MQQTFEDFFQEACLELIDSGISLHFNKKRKVSDAGGWFSEGDKELVVATAMKKSRWRQIFLHEYNHYCQWKEGSPWFTKKGKGWGAAMFWEWVTGEEKLSKYHSDRAVNYYQGLEHDCERRAIKMIKERGLDMNLEEYTKTANSYVWFYSAIRVDGQWCSKQAPYRVPEIMEMMPGDKMVSLKKMKEGMPKGFLELIREHCYKD